MLAELVREVVAGFMIPADFVSAAPYGSGHINDTFAVAMSQRGTPLRYIVQRINHRFQRVRSIEAQYGRMQRLVEDV